MTYGEPWLWLAVMTTSEFWAAAKYIVLFSLGAGLMGGGFWGAYQYAKRRDHRLAAVARQVGADLVDDDKAPTPPPLHDQLQSIGMQLFSMREQIGAAEVRLGDRIQSLVRMDQHLLDQITKDRDEAHSHRTVILARLTALEAQGGRQEKRDLDRA